MIPFEPLEHTADIGLRSYGKTLKEAFENAARGMFSLMTDLAKVENKKRYEVEVRSEDAEGLLVEWLNELVFLFETELGVFKDVEITDWDEKSRLQGFAYGEDIDLNRHQFETQIKACTYHMLKISKNDLWKCQVIFDV